MIRRAHWYGRLDLAYPIKVDSQVIFAFLAPTTKGRMDVDLPGKIELIADLAGE